MPATSTSASVHATTDPAVILLTGERFFVRRIPIAADSPAAPQVELALETISPFPLEQMFHGHVIDRAQRHALVYSAYRRNFSAAEQADWANAESVLPDFLMHVFVPRGSQATDATLHETDAALTAIAWDSESELPALILHRPVSNENREQSKAELLAELTRRTQVDLEDHSIVSGPITAKLNEKQSVLLSCEEHTTPPLSTAFLAHADVRDGQVLATKRRANRSASLWCNTFTLVIVALVLCLVVELGMIVTSKLLDSRQGRLDERNPEIEKIESAQNLANRLETLAAEQLRPFEMLAAINAPRPQSVEFLRVSTRGPLQLEIDAQTANANDLRTYEAALKSLPFIASVTISDSRSRSGLTTFSLEVTFKPRWTQTGGGS